MCCCDVQVSLLCFSLSCRLPVMVFATGMVCAIESKMGER